jgi:hypothetical protein
VQAASRRPAFKKSRRNLDRDWSGGGDAGIHDQLTIPLSDFDGGDIRDYCDLTSVLAHSLRVNTCMNFLFDGDSAACLAASQSFKLTTEVVRYMLAANASRISTKRHQPERGKRAETWFGASQLPAGEILYPGPPA